MLAKDFVIQLEENYKFNGASNLGASIPFLQMMMKK